MYSPPETAELKLLVELLATVDATFRPRRDPLKPAWSESFLRRAQYAWDGVPVRPGDPTEAGRKRFQRTCESAIRSGLLIVGSGDRQRLRRLRMTANRGEIFARRVADLPSIAESWLAVEETRRLIAAGHCAEFRGETWVAEASLASAEWGSSDAMAEFRDVELLAAPALCRRWMFSNSDLAGRVWYRLGELPNSPPRRYRGRLPEPDDRLADLYDKIFVETQAELANVAEQSQEIGPIPVPDSLWGQVPLVMEAPA
jgi:hypothetical protein